MPTEPSFRKSAALELSFLSVMVSLVVCVGCGYREPIHRKTVQDLYHDALQASAERPPIIQPSLSQGPLAHEEVDPVELDPLETLSMPSSTNEATTTENLPPLPKSFLREKNNQSDAESTPTDSTRRSRVNACHPRVVAASHSSQSDALGISEIFEQTDIREALQILAAAANQSIVVDETVGGVVSAQIENESFEQALQKIIMPMGLVYAQIDNRYIVTPPDPESPLFPYVSERTQFAPNYHDITKLTSLLPPRFKPFLQVSDDRNLVVIDAPREIGRDILNRLQELDQPVPQIELEAIVCVVSPDSGFRFGLDWGHVVGVDGVDSFKAGMTGLTFSGAASRQGFDDAFSDFAVTSAFVRLLAQEGYITIRAAPRVTSKDGEKASISINREAFFSLQPSNSNLLFRQDVQKVDSGISLEIVPRVHGDIVAVNIAKAEVSEDIRSSEAQSSSSNPFPIINRRVVSTNVNVRDGHTIVIGGLVQSQTVDRISRVPGLSRVPVLGKMFQTVDKQKQDAEVAIFISPRIIHPQIAR